MHRQLFFVPLFCLLVCAYLLCFEFPRAVMFGRLSATGAGVNLGLIVVITCLGALAYLGLHRLRWWLATGFALLGPLLMPTLFVEALLAWYQLNDLSSPLLVPPHDYATWFVDAPRMVFYNWYIFYPPTLAGLALHAVVVRWQRRHPDPEVPA